MGSGEHAAVAVDPCLGCGTPYGLPCRPSCVGDHEDDTVDYTTPPPPDCGACEYESATCQGQDGHVCGRAVRDTAPAPPPVSSPRLPDVARLAQRRGAAKAIAAAWALAEQTPGHDDFCVRLALAVRDELGIPEGEAIEGPVGEMAVCGVEESDG
jgi:hypothetical protein